MITYEILEKVINHYFVEGNQFGWNDKEEMCAYYTPSNGAKCAIGLLLPDARRFQSEVGSISIGDILFTDSLEDSASYQDIISILPEDLDWYAGGRLLQSLQMSHDFIAKNQAHYAEKSVALDTFKNFLHGELRYKDLEDVAKDLEDRGLI